MSRDSFPQEVIQQVKWYVYRLLDPRNGETFYVGKGQGNRIFNHVKGAIGSGSGEVSDPKIARIKDIQAAGLEVSHVIHRHGLASSSVAEQVEAALIDAYPGLTNKQAGKGSRDYGCRHAEEIIAEFEAEEFDVGEPLMVITINNQYYNRDSVYDAVRCAWKVSFQQAQKHELVLASLRGLIVGAFRPDQPWLAATPANFPGLVGSWDQGRWGFNGKDAEEEVRNYYVGKRVPERYRKKGAQNPVKYCNPSDK